MKNNPDLILRSAFRRVSKDEVGKVSQPLDAFRRA